MEIILMADMISSGKQEQPLTQNLFKTHIEIINNRFEKLIKSPLTITLGDEFQGIINNASDAVKIIVALEEQLLFENFPYNLRYLINEGEIDTEINKEIAYGMVGDGLTETRKILNASKKTKLKYLCFLNKQKDFRFYQGFFETFSSFINIWSKKKYGDLLELFIDPKHSEKNKDSYIANWFEIDPSTVWKKRKSLNINAYLGLKKMLNYYE